jgi:hypothetical protein
MVKRPPTMREIQAAKEKPEVKNYIIQNICKQLVKIHQKPRMRDNGKREDFYVGAEDVNLYPNKIVELREDRVWKEQLDRLAKKRQIKVLSKPATN